VCGMRERDDALVKCPHALGEVPTEYATTQGMLGGPRHTLWGSLVLNTVLSGFR
jgi:hypothetical protein